MLNQLDSHVMNAEKWWAMIDGIFTHSDRFIPEYLRSGRNHATHHLYATIRESLQLLIRTRGAHPYSLAATVEILVSFFSTAYW